MSTRTSSSLALLLASCSASIDPPPSGSNLLIGCALDGAGAFDVQCQVQRVTTKEGLQLVVRHPDGGFRRFDVLTDGRGLATADGAEVAQIAVFDDGIDVTVGNDRYRLPATIANHER